MDKNGRTFIVEMQMYWTENFRQRVLFNASKAYIRQLSTGESFDLLQPVYVLSFVNDVFEPNLDAYYHHYNIVNIENTQKKIEGLEFVFVELPKFKAKNIVDKKMQILWLNFLSESERNQNDIPPELLENEIINKAFLCLEQSSFSEEELWIYDKYLDAIRIEKTRLKDAYTKGMQKGKLERNIEIAKKMLSQGLPSKQITEFTGLSAEELKTQSDDLFRNS